MFDLSLASPLRAYSRAVSSHTLSVLPLICMRRAMSRISLPLTFRAVGSSTPGAPFESISRTIQSLQPDELLARVSYASINAMDGKIHNGKVNIFQVPLPMVLGYDFSGEVVAMGTDGPYQGRGGGADSRQCSDGLRIRRRVSDSSPEPSLSCRSASLLATYGWLCDVFVL